MDLSRTLSAEISLIGIATSISFLGLIIVFYIFDFHSSIGRKY
jgi:hypothetical protein